MKIALLTIHWANNYGASLQTFATVKALEKYGQVTVLDYRSEYAAKGMQLIRWGLSPRDILRIGKDLFRLIPRYRAIRAFREFTFNRLSLSEKLCSDDDFSSVAPEFDLFVCGSDQIWNPDIVSETGEIDEYYFLKFAEGKPRISYASSMGTHRYTATKKDQVGRLLSGFSAISVREKDSADYLGSMLARDVTAVMDPTLLLGHSEWLEAFAIDSGDTADEPFILVYALKKDRNLKAVVEFYRKKLGLKIVCIDQDPFLNYKPDVHLKHASPEEFVQLFHQADFIITNSFHGTCFSVLFNKSFVVCEPPSGKNRIMNLLSVVGLSGRFVSADRLEVNAEADWATVNKLLAYAVNESFSYLDRSIVTETDEVVV